MDNNANDQEQRISLDGHSGHSERGSRQYAGTHHARFIDERVPFHIISRVFQGRHLLRPDPELNDLIIGVVGRAQTLFRRVELFALVVMSNHIHAIARGPANELPFFVGYIKREISIRFGARPDVDWRGGMWHEYVATALPTEASQTQCLRYVLAQSVKEHLTERPQDWPGVHCAKALLLGRKLWGHWLDASAYFRAKQAEGRKAKRGHVRRADFLHKYEIVLTPLPAWTHLDDLQRRAHVADMVREICADARDQRAQTGRTVLGPSQVARVSRERRTQLPPPPWFELRKRMVCWSDPRAAETRSYLASYWNFQKAFREASIRLSEGDFDAVFPPGAFRPVTYHKPPG